MKTIELDGKKYYLADDVDKELAKTKNKNDDKGEFSLLHKNMPLDAANVVGIGSCELKGKWAATTVSIEYLGKIVSASKNMGFDSLTIVWSNDQPVIFGRYEEQCKGKISGFILAPRVNDD